MTKSLEALIADIKPVLKIAIDKTKNQSDAFTAIDRLSDLLTLPAVDALIAALEQKDKRIAELESLCVNHDTTMRGVEQLCVKLPAQFYFVTAAENIQVMRVSQVIEAIRAAGGTIDGE